MHETIQFIHDHGERLRAEHTACDSEGKLTQAVRDIIRDSRGMRLLQATDQGGFEADPSIFFEWVRTVARYNASAGWVSGVVGVHPWEVALVDAKLADEIYGDDPDVWVASPYAPQGKATREGDGFRFSGHWQYSTGTDHCDWIVLGGRVVDESTGSSGPPEIRHFFLPRGDYEIVEDSWHVMGLGGTGSKDVHIDGAFVPAYRTLLQGELSEGGYGARRAGAPVYQVPWGSIFCAAITAAVFGIAQGMIDRYHEYVDTRVSAMGIVGKNDPYQQEAIAEVEADVAAGITHLDVMMNTWLRKIRAGNPISPSERLEFRRNQVRAVQRVLLSVDKLMARSGSAAIWTNRPLERYWRDLRTAGTHISVVSDVIYNAWANDKFNTGVQTFVMH